MGKENDQQEATPTTEELLVAVLARLCVIQGSVDALVFAVSLLNKAEDRDRGFSECFSRVQEWAIAGRVGYLTEQYPQFRKLLDDHVQVGQRTTREIFAQLQAKFDLEQLDRNEQ